MEPKQPILEVAVPVKGWAISLYEEIRQSPSDHIQVKIRKGISSSNSFGSGGGLLREKKRIIVINPLPSFLSDLSSEVIIVFVVYCFNKIFPS